MNRCVKSFFIVLVVFLLSLRNTLAQAVDPAASAGQPVLVAEELKSHHQRLLTPGMTLGYKTFTSKHFKKGRLGAFTDSTISFINKSGETSTMPHKDIAALKIINSSKKLGGALLVFSGGVVFLVGGTGYIDETITTLIPTVLLIGGGTALIVDKKMYLAKSWVGQTVTYKSLESHRLEKGRIMEVTDSTISFESNKTGKIATLSKDKAYFEIKRNNGFGSALILAGFAGLTITAALGGGYFIVFVGAPAVALMIAGVAVLASPKKIYLNKSWNLKTASRK